MAISQGTDSLVSDSVAKTMIARWKHARLTAGTEALGYPTVAAFAREGLPKSGGSTPLPDKLSDAQAVQDIVDQMAKNIRETFEAYHLGLIGEKRLRATPHTARAILLGISRRAYYLRVKRGYIFLRQRLLEQFDDMHSSG